MGLVPDNLIANSEVSDNKEINPNSITIEKISLANSADTKANTGFEFIEGQGYQVNKTELEKRYNTSTPNKKYPKGVLYVGKLEALEGVSRWLNKNVDAVVVNMSTIHFNNSFNAQVLADNPKYNFNKVLKEMASNNVYYKSNVEIADIEANIKVLPYINDYIAYRELGINTHGALTIDVKSNKWYYIGDVYPNGKLGLFKGKKDLPILDKFDPNPSNRSQFEESTFYFFNWLESQGIGKSFYIISETKKDSNGNVTIIPGHIEIHGKLPK